MVLNLKKQTCNSIFKFISIIACNMTDDCLEISIIYRKYTDF